MPTQRREPFWQQVTSNNKQEQQEQQEQHEDMMVTLYFTDNTNEGSSRKGGAVSHKPSVDHSWGDIEANALRWKWTIAHWPWQRGHFSLDLLVHEASSLFQGGYIKVLQLQQMWSRRLMRRQHMINWSPSSTWPTPTGQSTEPWYKVYPDSTPWDKTSIPRHLWMPAAYWTTTTLIWLMPCSWRSTKKKREVSQKQRNR